MDVHEVKTINQLCPEQTHIELRAVQGHRRVLQCTKSNHGIESHLTHSLTMTVLGNSSTNENMHRRQQKSGLLSLKRIVNSVSYWGVIASRKATLYQAQILLRIRKKRVRAPMLRPSATQGPATR